MKMYITRNVLTGAIRACEADYPGDPGLWSPVITIIDPGETVTATQQTPENSVANMRVVLAQANQFTIVKNERGQPVSAYLDPLNMSITIVPDDV